MKFVVDTADVAEIKSLTDSGLRDGVTTNPSLIAKAGRQMRNVIAEICAIVPGPVSVEVATTDFGIDKGLTFHAHGTETGQRIA